MVVSEEMGNAIAGIVSGTVAVMMFNPIDCLRIRWQVCLKEERAGSNIVGFARRIASQEGFVAGLWKPGLFANGMSIGLCTAVRLVVYGPIRDTILSATGKDEKDTISMSLAGFAAGATGYLCVTPFFQLKTRLQVDTGLFCENKGVFLTGSRKGEPRAYSGTIDAISKIVSNEGGVRQLYRGAVPLVFRGSLLSMGHLGGYDGFKTYALSQNLFENGESPKLHVAASVSAAFFACTLSNPADVIMTRWASAPTLGKEYLSISHMVKSIVREEGPLVLYRGWTVFFARLAPLLCVMMPLYEQTRFFLGLGYSS